VVLKLALNYPYCEILVEEEALHLLSPSLDQVSRDLGACSYQCLSSSTKKCCANGEASCSEHFQGTGIQTCKYGGAFKKLAS
jgi:hypothetical protein